MDFVQNYWPEITYHIIIDGEPHIESQSCLDAIQSLMSAYYVFNIQNS